MENIIWRRAYNFHSLPNSVMEIKSRVRWVGRVVYIQQTRYAHKTLRRDSSALDCEQVNWSTPDRFYGRTSVTIMMNFCVP
jgi:hypothetical protein